MTPVARFTVIDCAEERGVDMGFRSASEVNVVML